jgi:hypothetical protein
VIASIAFLALFQRSGSASIAEISNERVTNCACGKCVQFYEAKRDGETVALSTRLKLPFELAVAGRLHFHETNRYGSGVGIVPDLIPLAFSAVAVASGVGVGVGRRTTAWRVVLNPYQF